VKQLKRIWLAGGAVMCALMASSQSFTAYTTIESEIWSVGKTSLKGRPAGELLVEVQGDETGVVFHAWGTTFNELDWDAYNLLTRDEQDEIMHNLYAPDGDLRFTHGRVSMNANDYARSWYSCSEVSGDFELRHFNIERDKRNIIPLARAAQKYCPELQLFMSPWSPPTWMKINQDYPVLSSKYNNQDPRQDYVLYMDDGKAVDPDEMKLLGARGGVFPHRLALQDYLLMTTHPILLALLSRLDFRSLLLLLLLTLLFAAMYALLPGRRNSFRKSLPGAALASSLWLTFSWLFSLYVEYFTRYTNIYGSIYALALGMLWLYFCISIFFYGAAWNQFRTKKNKT
jgi:hypothetical protein